MRFSIIIPTIGRSTLPLVLEGIKACWDYKAIAPEILVIVDGEKSQISNFNIQYSGDANIKVLETGKKVYAGGARNAGIEAATGEVIIFLQDDTIPDQNWLQKIYKFHVIHAAKEKVLLGKVSWTKELARDPFHRWLENHGQFAFRKLENLRIRELKNEAYKFFYTSNISVKRALIGSERFSDQFEGWGFEDVEFGYRLQQRGMNLVYDSRCEVFHDHPQTLEDLVGNTANAKKNAKIFEQLHPEISIRSAKGLKWLILKIILWFLDPFTWIHPKLKWWVEWKKAWI